MGSEEIGKVKLSGKGGLIMEKKEYIAPELTLLGDVEEITKGEGCQGNDDQWWFFHWGTDPTSG
jgi:hypothetical protein